MKKAMIIFGSLIGLIALGVGGYFLYKYLSIDNTPYYTKKDLTGLVVPPVTFPLKDAVLVVPEATSTSVTLSLVSPTAKRDYPMGRFTTEDGVNGSLFAQDDFVTEEWNGKRAVPIAVDMGGTGTFYYLAILNVANGTVSHINSLPIGDRIRVRNVKSEGEKVTVEYLVHDRGQAMAEIPRVETSAVFDINEGKVLMAGRVPQNEEVIVVKTFNGEYFWVETTSSEGEVVSPIVPDKFSIRFDANRIQIATDCNSGSTVFKAGNGTSTEFTTEAVASTKMFCESAQEADYFRMIESISTYEEMTDGSYLFGLSDGRQMKFVPKVKGLEFENQDNANATSS